MLRCTLGMDVDIDRSTGRAVDCAWTTWWRGPAGSRVPITTPSASIPLSIAFLIGSLVIGVNLKPVLPEQRVCFPNELSSNPQPHPSLSLRNHFPLSKPSRRLSGTYRYDSTLRTSLRTIIRTVFCRVIPWRLDQAKGRFMLRCQSAAMMPHSCSFSSCRAVRIDIVKLRHVASWIHG